MSIACDYYFDKLKYCITPVADRKGVPGHQAARSSGLSPRPEVEVEVAVLDSRTLRWGGVGSPAGRRPPSITTYYIESRGTTDVLW